MGEERVDEAVDVGDGHAAVSAALADAAEVDEEGLQQLVDEGPWGDEAEVEGAEAAEVGVLGLEEQLAGDADGGRQLQQLEEQARRLNENLNETVIIFHIL